jgi:hypothetical protein
LSPIKVLRERIKAEVLGSRDVFRERSPAPPSLTIPSILAEQEENNKKSEIVIIKLDLFAKLISK